MKPVICYAVARANHWRFGYDVIHVTSESTGYRGRIYGRDDGGPTNRAQRDVLARFPTEDAAIKAVGILKDVKAHHAPLIKAADKALQDARDAERADIQATVSHLERLAQEAATGQACDTPQSVA